MKKDPTYKAKLMALPLVDRARLLGGNWKIKPAAGLYFKNQWWNVTHRLPHKFKAIVRAWDLAGSNSKKKTGLDYCAGSLMGMTEDKQFYILDMKHFKGTPAEVREMVKSTAKADQETWGRVTIRIPQDPGQAGVDQADAYGKMLAGFRTKFVKPTGSKVTRAEGLSSQVEQGNVFILRGAWNDKMMTEHEQFPDGDHDDMVDANADAFNQLAGRRAGIKASKWLS